MVYVALHIKGFSTHIRLVVWEGMNAEHVWVLHNTPFGQNLRGLHSVTVTKVKNVMASVRNLWL